MQAPDLSLTQVSETHAPDSSLTQLSDVHWPDLSMVQESPLHFPDLSSSHSSFVQLFEASMLQMSFCEQVCPIASPAPQLSWVVQQSWAPQSWGLLTQAPLASPNRVVLILVKGDALTATYPPVILRNHFKKSRLCI
jgi:hypothetical protein